MSSEEAIFQHAAKPIMHSLATVPLARKLAVAAAPGLKISLFSSQLLLLLQHSSVEVQATLSRNLPH